MDTNGNHNYIWQTLRYLMCFWNGDSSERPYHHWADSSGERATRKVSNHSHFTLCGGGLSSLVRVIMMSWGWISPRSVLLHTIYTMANPNTVLWALVVPFIKGSKLKVNHDSDIVTLLKNYLFYRPELIHHKILGPPYVFQLSHRRRRRTLVNSQFVYISFFLRVFLSSKLKISLVTSNLLFKVSLP